MHSVARFIQMYVIHFIYKKKKKITKNPDMNNPFVKKSGNETKINKLFGNIQKTLYVCFEYFI